MATIQFSLMGHHLLLLVTNDMNVCGVHNGVKKPLQLKRLSVKLVRRILNPVLNKGQVNTGV